MIKKMILALLILGVVLSLAACGETKILHCDGCGKEVTVEASSNMEEDWLVFCADCGEVAAYIAAKQNSCIIKIDGSENV